MLVAQFITTNMTDSSQIKAEIQALKMNMERIPRSCRSINQTNLLFLINLF